MTHSRTSAAAGFGAALVAVYATSVYVVGRLPEVQSSAVLALGVTLDLTLLVPGLYYLAFVRGRGWPVGSVGLVFLLSLAGAGVVIPGAYQAPLRVVEWLVVPVEGVLIGWVLVRIGRVVRRARARGEDEDVLTALRGGLEQAGLGRAAGAAAYEVALLTYALGRWRTSLPAGPQTFSIHRRVGYGAVFVAVLLGATVEMVGVHVLIARWSEAAAWGLTALSLYTVLWLVGDFQAIRHRPVRLERDRLFLRLGLRWEVEVPFDAIESVEPVQGVPSGRKECLDLTVLGGPHYLVRLYRPIEARGPYGWRKSVTSLGFSVDEPGRFETALQDIFGAWQRGAGRDLQRLRAPQG